MEIDQNNNNNNNNEEDNNNKNPNNKAPRVRGGRQKIPMKKISNTEDLLISFSKRRSGIYKKASELSTLCGADVGFLVFSPTGKPFSYGSPSIQTVIDKFTAAESPAPLSAAAPILEAHRRRRVVELSERHEGLFNDLDAQRCLRRDLKSLRVGADDGWWELPLDGLDENELRKREDALLELHSTVSNHLNNRLSTPQPFDDDASCSGSGPHFHPPPPPPPPPPSAGAVF